MNYDLATADELVAEAREARRRAEETARTYSWAAQQQEAAVKRSIPVPLGDLGNIDWQEVGLQRKRVEARRTLDRALEESGLAQKWAKTDQADAELKEYFASDGYRTGALGQLLKTRS